MLAAKHIKRLASKVQSACRRDSPYVIAAFGVAVMLLAFGTSYQTLTHFERISSEIAVRTLADATRLRDMRAWGIDFSVDPEDGRRYIMLGAGYTFARDDDDGVSIGHSYRSDGEKWLAQKYALVVYTEAAKNKLERKRDLKEWELAGLGVTKAHPGFSALPAVRSELESIIQGENGEGIAGAMHLDEEFTEETFSDVLDSTPMVHVASHFHFDPGTVADSFLLLGDGEHLTLEAINTGTFAFGNVEQLTFSACNTAMGTEGRAGREVEGLGAVVQNRGAKSVIVTLWSVADASTGIFMSRYYSFLQQEGKTKAEALKLAQIEFIKSTAKPTATGKSEKLGTVKGGGDEPAPTFYPGYSHPYYWAPFILMGNWM